MENIRMKRRTNSEVTKTKFIEGYNYFMEHGKAYVGEKLALEADMIFSVV